jgi:hypothetical protein
MKNLIKDVQFARVSNAVSAGTGTTDCTIIDTKGYDEVTFVLSLGTVVNNGVVTFQIAQADTNVTGDMVVSTATTGAITSDGTTIALSNKDLILTVTKPKYRYLEAQVVRATQNATINGVMAILSKPRVNPTTQGSSVYSSAIHASPGAA